ncbi:MAG: DNA repair protein RadA [Patescibacteria group bacterium]
MQQSTIFACTNCDAQFTKWTGRCLECGKWGTVTESKVSAQGGSASGGKSLTASPAKISKLEEIQTSTAQRLTTHIGELDRVFGGGIVPGSLTLLGGEPGIGKSTLALQLGMIIPNTLYVSGEESVEQIKLRADRIKQSAINNLKSAISLANETNVESIIATIQQHKPGIAIIDSIQTISSEEIPSEAGSMAQVRTCTVKLLEAAKATNTAILLIGHVTKDGEVAGPKTLEHLVDTVLYLEGDRFHNVRLLRSVKNRFGPTDEVGIFEMKESGLAEVKNPSALFLEERGENMTGSVITVLLEGTRPMLVEIQALVNKTAFGYPVRKASGFDLNRLHVLIAVLQKRAGLNLGQYDVHINVVGGIRADEPAADLAVCLAITSAYKDKMLGNDLACFGEVGLGGEIRSVRATDKRIKECEQLGMKKIIAPKMKQGMQAGSMKIIEVRNIQELIRQT